MTGDDWEYAVIGPAEAQTAAVVWDADRRLPSELIPIAIRLGYSTSELATYALGQLTDDLVVGGETYLRGALVLPDEDGLPATLFGKPLLKE
jgi:hypothetical protein